MTSILCEDRPPVPPLQSTGGLSPCDPLRGRRLFCKYSNTKFAIADAEWAKADDQPLATGLTSVQPFSTDMILDGQTRHFLRFLRSQVGEEPKRSWPRSRKSPPTARRSAEDDKGLGSGHQPSSGAPAATNACATSKNVRTQTGIVARNEPVARPLGNSSKLRPRCDQENNKRTAENVWHDRLRKLPCSMREHRKIIGCDVDKVICYRMTRRFP
jgi:hypothetical protein